MIQEKLIEDVVRSYNIVARKLVEALTKKDTAHEEINRLYGGLKEHRKTIKRLFKDRLSLEVFKPEIKKVLTAIRDNEDIFRTLQAKDSIDEDDIADYYDGIDYVIEINGEYDLENFIMRRMEAGALIIERSISPNIVRLFDKVKELYMFGAYEATIVFCRALIEETLKQAYRNQNPKIPRQKIDNMELYVLLRDVVFPKTPHNLKTELDKVRLDAKRFMHRALFDNVSMKRINVVHGTGSFSVTNKNATSIQKSALSAIRASTHAIESFFSTNTKLKIT